MSPIPTTVLQLTDTHIFADPTARLAGMDTRASFRAVYAQAIAELSTIDALLLTGDLAAEAEAGAYRWLAEELQDCRAPIYFLPGNHDDPAAMEALLGGAAWRGGPLQQLGSWRFVQLNSAVPKANHGCLAECQLEILCSALRDTSQPTLVALHHHPILAHSEWMDTMVLQNAAEFWQIIEANPQVRGVLWGHVHQNFDAYDNPRRLLATPSTCVQFAPRAKTFALDSLAPAYRYLRLFDNGEIDTAVVRVAQSARRR